jgi:putative peptidoglycan lipid II flippase
MVTRVLTFLYREIRGLHQAAYILALFTIASQILAVVRDRLLAHQFGAGPELDIYYAAFRIPDLLFVLFASVLSVYVLLPFVKRAQLTNDESAQRVLGQMFSLFLLVYVTVAIALFLAAPAVIKYLYPGFTDSALSDVVLLLRILLLQPFFLGISSLLGVVTQLHHRFVVYALSPLLYNVAIIFGAAVLYPYLGIAGLGWGVVLGALGHVLVQIPLVYKSPLSFTLVSQFDWKLLGGVARVALPRAFTLSLGQILFITMTSIATTMAVGSVAIVQFAFNLQSVPLAVIGASYSVAAFPTLTTLIAEKKMDDFAEMVLTALRHILFWSVPVIALVVVLRAQIVRVLLGSGSFDWADTRLTAAVLAMFVVSLAAQAMIFLVVRAFYAGGHTRLPLFVTGFGTVVGIVCSYIGYRIFEESDSLQLLAASVFRLENVVGVEVLVLPLAFTIAMCIEAVLLMYFLRTTYHISLRSVVRQLWQASLAALAGGITAYAILNFVVEGINQNTFMGILMQGIAGGIFGVIAIICVYYLLGSRELAEIYRSFRTRIFKTDVVAPQPDVL